MVCDIHLVSFASDDLMPQQRLLSSSGLKFGGIDHIDEWTTGRLRKTEYYSRHRGLLSEKRGAGYWAWKPYLIWQRLNVVPDNDWVVYHDVGRGRGRFFCQSIAPLLDWTDRCLGGAMPGVYIPQWGPNRRWTKRDCFVGMGCDSALYWDHCQVQAGVSVWRNTCRSREFVAEWMEYCTRREVISDDPNIFGLPDFEEFKDHRHDQSVLTNLCLKRNLCAFGSQNRRSERAESINSLVDIILDRKVVIALVKARRVVGELFPDAVRDASGKACRRIFRNLPPKLRHLVY